MSPIRGVNKTTVPGDLDVGAGVLAAIKICRQCAPRVERLELPGLAVEMIRGDAIALLVVAINDRKRGMKREMPRLKPGGRAGRERLVFREFSRVGIEAKLIDGVRAGMGHERESIRTVRQDGVGTALGLDPAERPRLDRAVRRQRVAAHHAAAVTGPKQRFACLICGDVSGIGADVCDAKRNQFFTGTIDAKSGHTVGAAHRDVKPLPVRADELRSRRTGQIVFCVLHQLTGVVLEFIEVQCLVLPGGDGHEHCGDQYILHGNTDANRCNHPGQAATPPAWPSAWPGHKKRAANRPPYLGIIFCC